MHRAGAGAGSGRHGEARFCRQRLTGKAAPDGASFAPETRVGPESLAQVAGIATSFWSPARPRVLQGVGGFELLTRQAVSCEPGLRVSRKSATADRTGLRLVPE